MRRYVIKIWDWPSSKALAITLILSVAFLTGGLVGCLVAGQVNEAGNLSWGDYLTDYLSLVHTNGAQLPSIFSLLWDVLRWPLLIFALGLTPIGLLGIPIAFLIRGFLLSFSASSFFCVYGIKGLLSAFVIFGISELFCIVVQFILGVHGFLTAGALAGRLMGESIPFAVFNRTILIRYGFCVAGLFLCGCIEYFVVPGLLEALSALFLS